MQDNFKANLQTIIERLPAEDQAKSQLEIDRLMAAGAISFEALLDLVNDQTIELELRMLACWVLARLGHKRAAPTLLNTLQDPLPDLRQTAAQYLGELGSKRAVQPLIAAMLDDEASEVRKMAAYGLGCLTDRRALEPLLAVLSNQNEVEAVRGQAAEVLAYLGEASAVPALLKALVEPEVEVRFWVVFGLGQLGDARVVPELERLAATDEAVLPGWWSISQEALDAIEAIKSREADESS